MIKNLYIENYRGFKKHSLTFNDITLLVGKNNAGKSTIIEILRLCSLITKRYKTAQYVDIPNWVTNPHTDESRFRIKGISPDIKKLIKQYPTIVHKYNEIQPYAKIVFTNNTSIEIFYNTEEQIFAIIRDVIGNIVKTKTKAQNIDIPEISTLPQIGPLHIEEKVLQLETVKKAELLPQTSLHFRNKLNNADSEVLLTYKELVTNTWSDLYINEINNEDGELSLFVREKDFTAEVGVMGHGLQMWLQILWFIHNSKDSTTLIIDEPDVYLHADLQKKLYEVLLDTKNKLYYQAILLNLF